MNCLLKEPAQLAGAGKLPCIKKPPNQTPKSHESSGASPNTKGHASLPGAQTYLNDTPHSPRPVSGLPSAIAGTPRPPRATEAFLIFQDKAVLQMKRWHFWRLQSKPQDWVYFLYAYESPSTKTNWNQTVPIGNGLKNFLPIWKVCLYYL